MTRKPRTQVARRVARVLGNARLLTLDGYGHTTDVDPSMCIDHALNAYLIRPATARRQTCHADRQPFDPDFGRPLPAPSHPVIAVCDEA